MKARDAENVAGSINNSGLISVAILMASSTGSTRVMVAILEVNSVRNVMKKQINMMIRTGEKLLRTCSSSDNTSERPELAKPFASANPPPKRRMMSNGRFFTCFPADYHSVFFFC